MKHYVIYKTYHDRNVAMLSYLDKEIAEHMRDMLNKYVTKESRVDAIAYRYQVVEEEW